MTLLATEIHNHDAVDRAFIVFAADRRITRKSGEYGGTRKKIFALPWLNAGIGYFGLAEVLETAPACQCRSGCKLSCCGVQVAVQ